MDQPTETQPVFTQTPVEPEAPKKSYTWLLILVLLALAAGLGFFAWENYRLRHQLIQVRPSPSPGVLPVVTEDLTSDWKDYSIEELKLVFKLPSVLTQPGNFTRVETPSEKGKQTCWALDMKQGFRLIPLVNAGGGSCVTNLFTIGATTIDHEAGRMGGFADYKFFQANSTIPSELVSEFDNQYGIKIIKVLGKNAPKIDPLTESGFPLTGSPGEGYIGAILQYNTGRYQALTVQMRLTSDLTPEIFDQILSTFKFTE